MSEPPDCCGHDFAAHERGFCQIVLNDGPPAYGIPPQFCPCPLNERWDGDDE